MNDLRYKLRAMWAISLVARVRGACTHKPPPQLREPRISLGSQLAAHRVRTAMQRRETHHSSLLAVCLAAVCRDVTRLGETLEFLPPDLQQAVLDTLIASGQLTDSTVRLFRGLPVFEVQLKAYPGILDSWLPTFTAAQLIQVDVSGCSAVRLRMHARSALSF